MLKKLCQCVKRLFQKRCVWEKVAQSCPCPESHYAIFCVTHNYWYTGHIQRGKAVYIASRQNNIKAWCYYA